MVPARRRSLCIDGARPGSRQDDLREPAGTGRGISEGDRDSTGGFADCGAGKTDVGWASVDGIRRSDVALIQENQEEIVEQLIRGSSHRTPSASRQTNTTDDSLMRQ